MSDIQTMQEMITGLQQKKENLEADEAVFLKLSGVNETIEKGIQDGDEYKTELVVAKKVRDDAKKRKAQAVSGITAKISEKMNVVLPVGESIFTYAEDDDGKRSMKIGWKEKETVTPYNGLSGMQKQVFNAALANVLDANIIVVEAAELDPENLKQALPELSNLDKQVLVSTWLQVYDKEKNVQIVNIPENFKIIEV